MKLRLNDNSVRLRLRRSDVARFQEDGSVSAAIRFPDGGALAYRLSAWAGGKVTVTFASDTIEVRVPAEAADEWCRTDRVGIYGSDGSTEILVEKDFRRTSLPSPDDDDRYPNPRSAARQP